MPQQYVNPGAAFATGLDDALASQELLRQKMQMNALAMQREQRLQRLDELHAQEAEAALAEKRDEARERIRQKERADTEKDVSNMVPGDIPDADLLERVKKHHVPIRLTPPLAQPQGVPMMAQPEMQGAPAGSYMGNAQQEQQLALQKRVDEVRGRLSTLAPDSPDFKKAVIDYEMITGKPIPANLLPKPAVEKSGIPIVRMNRAPNAVTPVERFVDSKWVPLQGDAPAGAHFVDEPLPKDNTVHDLAREKSVEESREHARKELIDMQKPLESQIQEFDKIAGLLGQHTAEADTVIAPIILKGAVGGQGSGFRMTRAEIENVLGGRTAWETLKATLNKYSGKPQKEQIPDDQRTAMEKLARYLRKKAYQFDRKVIDMRYKIDDSDDVKSIGRMRTKLHDEMFPAEEEDEQPMSDDAAAAKARAALDKARGKK